MCPPFQHLDAVVDKIVKDQAEGIMLIPTWKSSSRFHTLGRVAVKWWDLPRDEAVLQTPYGKPIPWNKDLSLRVVVLNAFEATRKSRGDASGMDASSSDRVNNMVPSTQPEVIKTLMRVD